MVTTGFGPIVMIALAGVAGRKIAATMHVDMWAGPNRPILGKRGKHGQPHERRIIAAVKKS